MHFYNLNYSNFLYYALGIYPHSSLLLFFTLALLLLTVFFFNYLFLIVFLLFLFLFCVCFSFHVKLIRFCVCLCVCVLWKKVLIVSFTYIKKWFHLQQSWWFEHRHNNRFWPRSRKLLEARRTSHRANLWPCSVYRCVEHQYIQRAHDQDLLLH